MIDITICVGSSCHLSGSNMVLESLKSFIFKEDLTEDIKLAASFCMGDCQDGVCITINEKKLRHINPQNISTLFDEIRSMKNR